MKLYTGTGDGGETALWGGGRVRKDNVRIAVVGAVDECNAAIGVALAAGLPDRVVMILDYVQNTLFVVGSDLIAASREGPGARIPRVDGDHVAFLEAAIDELDAATPPLRNFILPGGGLAAAHLHLARAMCRRAEREYVALTGAGEAASPLVGVVLNRLSDLLFAAARHVNHVGGVEDVVWQGIDR